MTCSDGPFHTFLTLTCPSAYCITICQNTSGAIHWYSKTQ